jgi:hypothetical protein
MEVFENELNKTKIEKESLMLKTNAEKEAFAQKIRGIKNEMKKEISTPKQVKKDNFLKRLLRTL